MVRGRGVVLVLFAAVSLLASACSAPVQKARPAAGIVSLEGGTVAGIDGASVTVPRGAVTKPTEVRIHRASGGYDIHLDGPYSGPVVVAVPVGELPDDVEPVLLHETADGFVVEDAARVGGFLVAEVASLSLFKVKKCVGKANPKQIISCLVREVGLEKIPSKTLKRILDDTNCGDITDIMGWIRGDEACPAGETPEDIARLRKQLPPQTAPPPSVSPHATLPNTGGGRTTSPPQTSPPHAQRRPPGAHYDVPTPQNAGGYDTRSSSCWCGKQSFVAAYDTITTASWVSYKGRGSAEIAISILDSAGTRLAERRFTLPGNQVTSFTADFNRFAISRGATYYMELRAVTDGMTIYLGNGDPYPQGRGYFDGAGSADFAMTIRGEDH